MFSFYGRGFWLKKSIMFFMTVKYDYIANIFTYFVLINIT